MDALLVLLVPVLVLVVGLGLAALTVGADSRDSIGDDHARPARP